MVTAAELVLERHGPGGLTTNRVAEAAGVSIGSLYQYFPNKQALVAAVSQRYLDSVLDLAREALAASRDAPLESLVERVAMAMMVAYGRSRPIHRWLVELRTEVAFQARMADAFDAFTADVAAAFAARADLRLPAPRVTAFVLVHAIHGVVEAASVRADRVDVAAVGGECARLVRAHLLACRAGG